MTTPTWQTATNETEEQRLQRMAQEVLSGRRSLNDIRRSVDLLAGREAGTYTSTDSAYQTEAQIIDRLRQIFGNRGVPIATGTGSTPTLPGPAAPLPQPPAPAPGPAPTPPAGESPTQRDAFARLNEVLSGYGLGSLGPRIQRWLVEGRSEAEIPQLLRETDEFKQRFPAIVERERKGLAPISPEEYINYERGVHQMMRQAGLPQGFYDSPEDFTRFIAGDVSLAELGERVTLAANAAFNAPQEVRDALAQWGVGPGELTAYWLDPDKAQPVLERRYAAATLAGTAQRTGWGNLRENEATGLAQQGITAQQAEQGFATLADSRELFGALDAGEDEIGRGEQLDATFAGNANARRRIEQRARRRQARFQGGGGFASSQEGLVGLGDANG